MQIRPWAPADQPALQAMNTAAVPAVNDLDADALRALLADALAGLVAEADGVPLGFAPC